MDILTRDDLKRLVDYSGRTCVSVYLPTHRAGAETLQNPTRLENLLREAAGKLRAEGNAETETNILLAPAWELVNHYDFWQYQSDSLAVFLGEGFFRTYRLPLTMPELVVVAKRLHLKPLLSAIRNNSHFYVLELGQSRVRLFRGSETSLVALVLPGLSMRTDEACWDEPVLRDFGAGSGDAVGRGRSDTLEDYFRELDQALHAQLANDPGPLIVACDDHQYRLYRKLNTHPRLLENWISSHTGSLSNQELHKQAFRIATDYFRKAQNDACDQYLALWHTQRASNKLSDVLPAALQGRVDSLLVAVGVQTWGHLNAATNEALISATAKEGEEDLLNLTAIHTYIRGGTVYAVSPDQIPGGGELAAVFRY